MGRPTHIKLLNDVAVDYCRLDGTIGRNGPNDWWRIVKQESDVVFKLSDGVQVVVATLVPQASNLLTPGQMTIYARRADGATVYISKISRHLATASDNIVYRWFTTHDSGQPTTAVDQIWLNSIEYYC